MRTNRKFPEVTERKYYKYRFEGDQFFDQLGFKIHNRDSAEFKQETVESDKTLRHKTHRDNFVFCNGSWLYSCTTISTFQEKKKLCVGGPFDGQIKANSQAQDYSVYNRSHTMHKRHKTILVYDKLLEENTK